MVLRVAMSARRSTPVNRNELGEPPLLTQTGHRATLITNALNAKVGFGYWWFGGGSH